MKRQEKYYKKNKDWQIEKQKKRRDWRIKIVNRYKSLLNCSDCGMSFKGKEICCDFHHIDPKTKRGGIRAMCNYTMKQVKEEIRKCIPLCANCHRLRHN